MAVTLEINPEHALLNDINPHLINLYKQVHQGLGVDPNLFVNEEEHYYQCRERFNELIRQGNEIGSDTALLLYYLNKTCFNGLMRFNSRGEFNVPFGKYKNVNYRTDFLDHHSAFSNWQFTCKDFESLSTKSTDFIFADPPYDDGFTGYSKEGFSWADQVRLADWLYEHKCPVLVTNKATDRILSLYEARGFTVELLDAPRAISCNGGRTPVKEMFAVRYNYSHN
jgi:DNA adenine methylase